MLEKQATSVKKRCTWQYFLTGWEICLHIFLMSPTNMIQSGEIKSKYINDEKIKLSCSEDYYSYIISQIFSVVSQFWNVPTSVFNVNDQKRLLGRNPIQIVTDLETGWFWEPVAVGCVNGGL